MARRRLGRGLDGLLPAAPPASERSAKNNAAIEDLHPGRMQPRGRIDAVALAELAASIREHGVLEPILVRGRPSGGFEIIAGERRWRAAQQAGLKDVPIFVHDLGDEAAFEAALVENLQREDLNAMETARAFQRLVDDYGYTQETIATKVGKERSTVANALRLLKLPKDVMDLVEAGELSEGHGRALLSAPNVSTMKKLARTAVSKGWSVREAERQTRRLARSDGAGAAPKKEGKSTNVRDLENRLSRALGSSTKIHESGKERGQLRISYSSFDELDRLIDKLT
ncbi:MAG: ParB/RepB/Spo0J family partition protein [Deltaproteobacteria bacterium]|nr:ParB/RepB/Spo0J family partition protein [Deltaproteobacteria bacterium]